MTPPRKHYQWYYSTRGPMATCATAPQGLHAFLRAYYHCKSADWQANKPFRLQSLTLDELRQLPTYYVMEADKTMAETVAAEMPSAGGIAACRWLPEDELAVYGAEFARTGFQGGLQWYRCRTGGGSRRSCRSSSGRTIDVPSCFIAGRSDWGIYQNPGDSRGDAGEACTRMAVCTSLAAPAIGCSRSSPRKSSRILIQFVQR